MIATSAMFDVPTDLSTAAPGLLEKELHQLRPGVTLYSGNDDWKQIQVFGGFMWFPPDRPGHPTVFHRSERNKDGSQVAYVADGRVQIKDRIGWFYNPVPGVGGRGKPSYGNLLGQDILAQVRFIVNKHKSIVWLRGDKSDGGQMARARQEARRGKSGWANMVMGRRRKVVDDARKQGTLPSPPSRIETEAQTFLDSAHEGSTYKEFVCDRYDGHYDTWEELRNHMLKAHNETLKPPTSLTPLTNAKVEEPPQEVVGV